MDGQVSPVEPRDRRSPGTALALQEAPAVWSLPWPTSHQSKESQMRSFSVCSFKQEKNSYSVS